MFFLVQCADEASVALRVRQLREWLQLPGLGLQVVERAGARRAILDAISTERHRLERVPPARTSTGRARTGVTKRAPRRR
jgi:hypothetical protein